jgi:hypothetical protein
MPPDQPAAPDLTGETARRWAAVQPASGNARIRIGDAPERAELVAGLRSLADYLAADPSVPVPPHGWRVAVYAEGADSEQFAQVDLVAEIIGEQRPTGGQPPVITLCSVPSGRSATNSPPYRSGG